MFLKVKRSGYDRDGQQMCSGTFLVLFSDDDNELFAVARFCALKQFGHFMMGSVKMGSQRIIVSGCYGSDGLPRNLNEVEDENRRFLTKMPDELKDKFWKDNDGWNSAGSEGPSVREWGIVTLLEKEKVNG